ncbi:microtubule organization protein AKNA [Lissotriton helveticus]
MAGSPFWVQQTEEGMGPGQQEWEENEEEEEEEEEESNGEEQDFEKYLNGNGVLRLEEQDVERADGDEAFVLDSDDNILGLEERKVFPLDDHGIMGTEEQGVYYPHSSSGLTRAFSYEKSELASPTHRQSFDLSDPRDTDSLPITSSLGEHSAGRHVGDSLDDLEPESLEDTDAPRIWIPTRDRQLDMTEDEQDRASSVELERPEEDEEGEGSPGEDYPDLPYDRQYGSGYDLSLEATQDSQGVYEEYRKVLGFENDWEESDVSPDQSRVATEHPYQLELDRGSVDSEQEDARSISQLGKTLAFPSDLPAPLYEGESGAEESNPLADSSRWNMSQSLLSHLSMEDLQNRPGIDDETFPESSYAESVDDSAAAALKMSTRGHRSSHSRPALATKFIKRQKGNLQKDPPSDSDQHLEGPLLRPGQALKTKMPTLLPSKAIRQSRSLSPKRNPVDKKTARSRSPRPSPTAESLTYGRGQLNYPLPDFSKVEPRVKFDQSYRPPRGRTLLRRPAGSETPLIFKSPAEIVREVLLSSTEGSPQKAAFSATTVPEEFKSPRQATELVHQLQEDYNKLLTKYAEAENTIDRLRLGAKVNLYSDPPKPSHSVQMGAVSQGSKVMAFTIPHSQVAQFSQSPSERPEPESRPSEGERTAAPQPPPTPPQADDVSSADELRNGDEPSPGEYLTQTLARQAEKFQRQVESFENQLQMGKLSPQEQIKSLQRLKGAQDTLERAYLQAREEHRLLQQRRGPGAHNGEFDPDRVVEGEIFRLGMQLEELKDGIDQTMQNRPGPSAHPEPGPPPNIYTTPLTDDLTQQPTPSAVAPVPAVRTPYPETPIPKESAAHAQVEVSSASSESDGNEDLPEPLQHKRSEVEKGFDHLLGQYNSFKTLPVAMGLESVLEEKRPAEEADGAAGDAGRGRRTWRRPSLKEEWSQTAPHPQPMERKPRAQGTPLRRRRPLSIQRNESQPKSPVVEPMAHSVNPKPSVPSRQSSAASAAGSHPSERLPQKRFLQPKVLQPEVSSKERIVSPDSGFVGSEGSRISPQTPEQHPPQSRCFQELSPSPSFSPPNKRNTEQVFSSVTRNLKMPNGVAKAPVTSALRSSLKKANPQPSKEKEPHVTLSSVRTVTPRDSEPKRRGLPGVIPQLSRIQANSPPRWSNSITDSESEQDAAIAQMDSENEEHSDAGTFPTTTSPQRSPSISASPSLSPPRTRTRTQPDLLGSRLARDEAIQALQNEVSRLRQRLEQTLQRPQGTPREALWSRTQTAGDTPRSWNSSIFGISTDGTPEIYGEPSRRPKPSVRVRSASLPRDGPDLDYTLDSDHSLRRPRSQIFQPEWATGPTTERHVDASIFTGPYTGTEYHLPGTSPMMREARMSTDSCPHCQGTGAPSPETLHGNGTRNHVMHSTPKQTMHRTPKAGCPLCSGSDTSKRPHIKSAPVPDRQIGASSSRSSEEAPKAAKQQQETQPGVWVMAGPPAPSPVSSYIPAVPLVPYSTSIPYSTSVVYCAPPAPTSASPGSSRLYYPKGYRVTEKQSPGVRQQSRGHRRSVTLGLEDLEDLRWSLSQAVDAAQSMKKTTRNMSRSLTYDLSNMRTLRESCLF